MMIKIGGTETWPPFNKARLHDCEADGKNTTHITAEASFTVSNNGNITRSGRSPIVIKESGTIIGHIFLLFKCY